MPNQDSSWIVYIHDANQYLRSLTTASGGRTTWVGPYSEDADPPNHAAGNGPSYMIGYGHVVLGGKNQVEMHRGFRLSDQGTINKANFKGSSLSDSWSNVCLGACDTTGSAVVVSFGFPDGQNTGQFRLMPLVGVNSGWVEVEVGRPTAERKSLIWMGDEATRPRGDAKLFKRSLLPPCPSGAIAVTADFGSFEDSDGLSLCQL